MNLTDVRLTSNWYESPDEYEYKMLTLLLEDPKGSFHIMFRRGATPLEIASGLHDCAFALSGDPP